MSVAAQSGDYLIALVALDIGTGEAVTWPAGFTERGSINLTGGDNGSFRWADKIAGGSEPGSYTISWTTGVGMSAAVLAWQGANATPRDVTPTANQGSQTATSTFNVQATGLAAGTAQRLLVHMGALDNQAGGTVSAAAPSASPSAWTEEIDLSNGNFANIALYTAVDAAGNFTSNVTSVETNGGGSGNGEWGAFMTAIRPA
jgi:hypothetical protein